MKLTEAQIQELTDLAELPAETTRSICRIMQLPYDYFLLELQDPESDIHKAFFTGRAKGDIAFQKKVTQLATQGSGPAQTLVYKLRRDQQLNELLQYYG
jgi:hypothetical protein